MLYREMERKRRTEREGEEEIGKAVEGERVVDRLESQQRRDWWN